jgi:hypothetical protein
MKPMNLLSFTHNTLLRDDIARPSCGPAKRGRETHAYGNQGLPAVAFGRVKP